MPTFCPIEFVARCNKNVIHNTMPHTMQHNAPHYACPVPMVETRCRHLNIRFSTLCLPMAETRRRHLQDFFLAASGFLLTRSKLSHECRIWLHDNMVPSSAFWCQFANCICSTPMSTLLASHFRIQITRYMENIHTIPKITPPTNCTDFIQTISITLILCCILEHCS